ncbi:MAG: hypothetical protein KKF56_04495 [Nanoarchaeota archaeon]|nr:hypothetical protein [Nanoarchaeota archaeon]
MGPGEYEPIYTYEVAANPGAAVSPEVSESETVPMWLAWGTKLGDFRGSLEEASKRFGKDIKLEIKVRDSPPADQDR